MSRVIHFEIHAENPERAIKFYTAVFGWEFTGWAGPQPYWLVKTGPDGAPGINGGMMKRMGAGPAEGQAVNAYVCTVGVDSVEEAERKVMAAGGTMALPRMAIPGVGWLFYAKDTEGNIFGVMQADTNAR
ncbi:MAG: VOC family protein [Candidatus Eisenbacteria bacterium]|nr:VOC family protein [Candidatus Eisenbacteria bacterium]